MTVKKKKKKWLCLYETKKFKEAIDLLKMVSEGESDNFYLSKLIEIMR